MELLLVLFFAAALAVVAFRDGVNDVLKAWAERIRGVR